MIPQKVDNIKPIDSINTKLPDNYNSKNLFSQNNNLKKEVNKNQNKRDNHNGKNINGKKEENKNNGFKPEDLFNPLYSAKDKLEGTKDVINKIKQKRDFIKKIKNKIQKVDTDKIKYVCSDFVKDLDIESAFISQSLVTKKKINPNLNSKALAIADNANKTTLFMKIIKEKKRKETEKEAEEKRIKKLKEEGEKAWKTQRNILRENKFKEVNYMDTLEEEFQKEYNKFKEEIFSQTESLLNQDFKKLSSELISQKHISLFKDIKNTLPEIKTLNFMVAGFTGAGKSALINAILKSYLAEEGNGIEPKTDKFESFSNPEKVPGITLYDTIGVEPANVDRNLEAIKHEITKTFDENIKDPEKSLHGILYCIKNGDNDVRIKKEEISYIKELNKLYGEGDILIIVFTQSTNPNTEERKMQLKEKLNNENIEIIEVYAKDYEYKFRNLNIKIEAFGLDELKEAMKKKCLKSLIKCNLKQIAKVAVKEKYLENTKSKYLNLRKRFKQHDIESKFKYKCKFIIENLLGNLELDFNSIEQIIINYSEKLITKILKALIVENKKKILAKMDDEFIIFNAKFDNLITKTSEHFDEVIFKDKFNEYFEPIIKDELEIILEEKAALLFMQKSREIIAGYVGEDVKDDELKYIVDLNVKRIFKK